MSISPSASSAVPSKPSSPLLENAVLSSTLNSLIQSGASWTTPKIIGDVTVHTLANIRYSPDDPAQSLDLYLPDDLVDASNSDQRCHSRPVYVHVHGGGWSRGAKDSAFYGGPAVAHAVAAAGCIAMAPGYRLGRCPQFLTDVAAALRWIRDHIVALGGDPDNMFLSGHSAGGHIASLLVLRHATFLDPVGIPRGFLRGVVLMSGVYDLFQPMAVAPLDVKNKWFLLAYTKPAFGTDELVKREHSPLLLLDPQKDTNNSGRIARASRELANLFGRRISDPVGDTLKVTPEDLRDDTHIPPQHTDEIEVNTMDLPPFLVMNASMDMGLQENGKLMAAALEAHTDTRYVVLEKTNHASICWSEDALIEVRQFVERNCSRKWKQDVA